MRWFMILLLCAGCSPALLATRGTQDPMLFNADRVAQADKIAIFIPGALSSIDVFLQTKDWEDAGYGRVFYRYPGLDGMKTDHHVSIPVAAQTIADFADRYPGKPITLVGYSTGGLIALAAAPQIARTHPVKVAAMSTAVEHGGGVTTVARGGLDVARAVVATKSVRKADVWKRFWAGLLFGPSALDDPAAQSDLSKKIAEGEKIEVRLDFSVVVAHMLGLPGWSVPDNLDLTGIPTAFFVGLNDPVFSTDQTMRFARRIGDVTVYGYPGQGHLLFFTRPDAFRDVLDFAEGRDPRT